MDREIERRGDGGHARAVARDVNRRIIADDETLPHFARASQNIAAAMALLHGLLEATTPKDRQVHREIHTLLERTAAQQAESSLSRRHELDTSQRMLTMCPTRDASVHLAPQRGRQRATILIHQRPDTSRYAAPSMLADAPTTTQEKEPTVAIILVVADATTVVRTGARALAC